MPLSERSSAQIVQVEQRRASLFADFVDGDALRYERRALRTREDSSAIRFDRHPIVIMREDLLRDPAPV